MKAAQQQPLKIHLQAKAKTFDFKFKAIKHLPSCYNLLHFSFFLKISNLLLLIRVSSDGKNNDQPTRRKSIRSRVIGFIDKFRYRPTTRNGVANRKCSRIKRLKRVSYEGPICVSNEMIGNLALLIQSAYEKDVKGIIIHCLSIFLYTVMQLKTFIGTKKNMLLLISVLAMVGYPLWLQMANHSSHGKRTVSWRYNWKAWNWASFQAFLHAIAQAVMEKEP